MPKKNTPTDKQIQFVAHYLICWNGAEAARRAGYSVKTAAVIAHENLTKPYIRSLIDERMKQVAMSAGEVLARLSDMARASLDDVINPDDEFDLTLARASGKMHLVKKIKRTQHTNDDGFTTRTTEIELHDAQAALVQLGKYHKLFTDKSELGDGKEVVIKVVYEGSNAKEGI